MDIKPYLSDFPAWTSLPVALLGLGLVLWIAIIVTKTDNGEYVDADKKKLLIMVPLVAFIGTALTLSAYMDIPKKVLESPSAQKYEKAQIDMIEKEGFEVTREDLDLSSGSKSSLSIIFEGNEYDCDVFSPQNVNANVVFDCGGRGLTLQGFKSSFFVP